MIIDGKEIQKSKLIEYKKKIGNLTKTLKLVVIQVGNDEASSVYVKNKTTACKKVGIEVDNIKYESITEKKLIETIESLNNDSTVTGILVQLPLPKEIDENNVINSIDPLKDVDGLTTINIGKLFTSERGLVPCTAKGIMEILNNTNTELEGKHSVIVGRSRLVGLPLIKLLLNENATVTVCHSKTKDLKETTKTADVLIVAVGQKHLITEEYVKEGAIVIDVGINRIDGHLYGDCDYNNIKGKCQAITPVPGGVGPLTITMLIDNIIEAYNLQNH